MGIATSFKLKNLQKQMNEAQSYAAWKHAARLHDEVTGLDRWKEMDQTRLYDHASIRRRLNRLRRLRSTCNDHGLLFALNEGIHGNMGGMGSSALYTRAEFGTKHLITEYIDEITEAIDYLAEVDDEKISFEEKLNFFRRASHCYGRSALMLSGGAMLGFFHLGVVKELVEQGVLPRVISGASAGSLVAGVLGTHTDEGLHQFFDASELVIEAKSEASWFNRMLLGRHPQIDVHDIEEAVERMIPDLTFQQAFELTGRRINISVGPADEHQTSRLLNATASPNVYIRSAVMASCAVPGVFPAVTLEAENVHGEKQPYLSSRRWVDGSVTEDLPAKRLARLYGVNHYIASQTNPFVLLTKRDPDYEHSIGNFLLDLAEHSVKEWARLIHGASRRYTKGWKRFNLVGNMIISIITQEYTADINILPRYRFMDPRKLFGQLSEEDLMMLISEGQKSTWPKLEMIRNCSKISRKLDELVHRYDHEALRRLAPKGRHRPSGGQPSRKSLEIADEVVM